MLNDVVVIKEDMLIELGMNNVVKNGRKLGCCFVLVFFG